MEKYTSEQWSETVTVGTWTGPLPVAVDQMDDDLREELHSEYGGDVTEQQFCDLYAAAHQERFGETWVIG